MKFGLCLSALSVALCLLSSCVTSTLATVAVAGAASGIPGVSALLGQDAPQPGELAGHSFDYAGEQRGVDNAAAQATGSILFGNTNPSVARLADGSTRSTFYSRQDKKTALITITTAAGVETYRLTFTDARQGSYTYEKRHGADFATGEGTFAIR